MVSLHFQSTNFFFCYTHSIYKVIEGFYYLSLKYINFLINLIKIKKFHQDGRLDFDSYGNGKFCEIKRNYKSYENLDEIHKDDEVNPKSKCQLNHFLVIFHQDHSFLKRTKHLEKNIFKKKIFSKIDLLKQDNLFKEPQKFSNAKSSISWVIFSSSFILIIFKTLKF